MLRKIQSDLSNKAYLSRAKELTSYRGELKERITETIGKKNKKLASAIRSVVEINGTIVVRADSRSAMSELYTFQGEIMDLVKKSGAAHLRFSV